MMASFWKIFLKLPITFILFIITILSAIIQASPVMFGFVLMLSGASAWSIITINSAFVIMPFEAWLNRASKIFFVLPLIWFGGFFVTGMISRVMYLHMDGEIRRFNNNKVFAYMPDENSLVITGDQSNSGLSEDIVRNYRITEVYEANKNFKPQGFVANRLVSKEICNDLSKDKYLFQNKGINTSGYLENRELIEEICVVHYPKFPENKPIFISSKTYHEDNYFLLPHELKEIKIYDATGNSILLHTGYARPFHWFPLPVLGCIFGGANWDCFLKTFQMPIKNLGADNKGYETETFLIARALQLNFLPGNQRITEIVNRKFHFK